MQPNARTLAGTTDPNAPFGVVTLASSGSEGGPNMGAMRQAQTGSYVSPLGLPPSFVERTRKALGFRSTGDCSPVLPHNIRGVCLQGVLPNTEMPNTFVRLLP